MQIIMPLSELFGQKVETETIHILFINSSDMGSKLYLTFNHDLNL